MQGSGWNTPICIHRRKLRQALMATEAQLQRGSSVQNLESQGCV